jgi:hypothetical protein
MVTSGFDPSIGAKNTNSSAKVLTANMPAEMTAKTTVGNAFFICETLTPRDWREVNVDLVATDKVGKNRNLTQTTSR